MNIDKLKIGYLGEAIAKEYLENKGYKIIEQNYRTRCCEIDLVVSSQKMLIFVEVRTKIGERFGTPEDSLNRRKISCFTRSVMVYLTHRRCCWDYRLDAVCIVLNRNYDPVRISHYQNII